jgi:YcxB-like protein
MSDSDGPVSFVLDYELSVDDLREGAIVARSAARRTKPLVSQWAWPVISLVLAAATLLANQKVTGCLIPTSTPREAPVQVWVWQCRPTSPNGLVWQYVWLVAADGAVWALTLIDLARAWARLPRWFLPRWMKKQGLQGRYRYEVAADGFTTASPDGTTSYIPWPVFTAVRETRERFFLFGPRYKAMWVLPKRALRDQSSVQRLGEFLRASAGRDASPT